MTGDEYRTTVNNKAVFDALASGRLTWWGQYDLGGEPMQRGDTIVFNQGAVNVRGERPSPLRMVVTDARDLTVSLPIGGSERTGDVFVARVLSLRPDSDGSG